jgi:hypothetical protein
MGLPRTFVGFSGTDLHYYRLMQAWKANTKIDFNFTDVQLAREIDSNNEPYIKQRCRERIDMAGTFIQLIGEDTRWKYKYVRWEAEVAIENGCRIIGVNLDSGREVDIKTAPAVIRDIGAIFVPFSPNIIAYTLENYQMHDSGNWHYKDHIYKQLGY